MESHQAELVAKKGATQEEEYVAAALAILIEYVHRDYKSTITKIQNLKKHKEITHELLYSIMVPRSILITKCPITGEPRALQLVGMNRMPTLTSAIYELIVENIDAIDDTEQLSYAQWGRVRNKLFIHGFKVGEELPLLKVVLTFSTKGNRGYPHLGRVSAPVPSQ